MKYVTNRQRILSMLRRSKRGYTAAQVSDKLGLGNTNAVYAEVSRMIQEGYTVHKVAGSDGLIRYSVAS